MLRFIRPPLRLHLLRPVQRHPLRPHPQGTPIGPNQFATEAQAKARCPSDSVVWANLNSHIYHFSGYRNYGTTKDGAYMCESDTVAAGLSLSLNTRMDQS